MGLTLKSFAQFTSDLQSGIIGLTKKITDFSSGSVANALTEVVATQLGFVQSEAPIVLAITRASTSKGADLASFTADFGLMPPGPLPATFDTGTFIFTKNQPSTGISILLDGTIVQNQTPSPSSAIQYVITPNASDPNWSANAGGFGISGRALAAGLTTLSATAQAVVSGTGSNLVAGTPLLIASPNVPFDSVSLPATINNAVNGESDPALRQRFIDFISTRSGTRFTIAAVVEGFEAGLSFTLNDYTLPNGTIATGNGTIVVDDGTGQISQTLLTQITAAVVSVTQKSFGAYIYVIAPINVNVSVALTGTTIANGFAATDVRNAIQAALIAAVNGNGVGGAPAGTGSGTPSNKLSYVALANLVASFIGTAAGQGLSSYGALTLNGSQADVVIDNFHLARAQSVTVT